MVFQALPKRVMVDLTPEMSRRLYVLATLERRSTRDQASVLLEKVLSAIELEKGESAVEGEVVEEGGQGGAA